MDFSTADLCDEFDEELRVLNKALIPYGGLDRCLGQVVTIKLDEDNSDLITLLKQDGHGKVAVVDAEAKFCAVVGDNLMGFAHKHGWAGIIINGYVRDTRETNSIDVGLWALGTCPRKSKKKAKGEINITLDFGDITIQSDDYLYADIDGIVVSDKNLLSLTHDTCHYQI